MEGANPLRDIYPEYANSVFRIINIGPHDVYCYIVEPLGGEEKTEAAEYEIRLSEVQRLGVASE